jgi:uncharacterized protein
MACVTMLPTQQRMTCQLSGENNLRLLLRHMEPVLFAEPYGIVTTLAVRPATLRVFAEIAESEGTTLVAARDDLAAAGFDAGEAWARISLTIHSDLAAVGLTAALATALAGRGISANVIAGYFHDHVFVPWDRRDDAVAALRTLTSGSAA